MTPPPPDPLSRGGESETQSQAGEGAGQAARDVVERRALDGVRVLVAAVGESAGRLAALLENDGAHVWTVPLLAVRPPEDTGPLRDALRNLHAYDWIALTSRNAVRAVFDIVTAQALPPTLRVAAVGRATAAELEVRRVAVSCVPEEETGASLAAAMCRHGVEGVRVLLPVGDRVRPALRLGLEAGGALVDSVLAYRTVAEGQGEGGAIDALSRGEVDVIAATSPSAVETLLALLPGRDALSAGVRLACIGPTTAEATRKLGLVPTVVAGEQSLPGLAAAIRNLYATEGENDHI